jgi:hypothetical protein
MNAVVIISRSEARGVRHELGQSKGEVLTEREKDEAIDARQEQKKVTENPSRQFSQPANNMKSNRHVEAYRQSQRKADERVAGWQRE